MNSQNNNNYLQTGESYSLSQIFSDDKKIYIPDLQRDYCWGNGEKENNKVYGFLKSLKQLFLKQKENEKQERIHLGIIYGYLEEYNPGRIMLCDGQQRLTSLFLIIGMLNRISGDNYFQKLLISDRELHEDDREPYLQYAIRESTMAFISDLVCQFFICDDDGKPKANVSNIDQERWFYDQYRFDPSIQSMKEALKVIDQFFSEQRNSDEHRWKDCDFKEFGKFISESLLFMYYDMGSRSDGEKTFVVINNSGEPLTRMENLKPFMVKSISDCKRWENMVDWFWKHRNLYDTSDPGMNEFFRMVMYLESRNTSTNNEEKSKVLPKILSSDEFEFPHEEISLDTVIEYFEAYKRLNLKTVNEKKQGQKEYAWLIPSLFYSKKFETANYEDIERIKHLLNNTTKYRDNYKLEYAISLVDAMSSPDILSFLDCKDELTKYDKREELTTKLKVISNNQFIRKEIESSFLEAENHGVWHGEIKMLIDWSGGYEAFSLTTFKRLYDNSVLLFGNIEYSNKDVCIQQKALRLLLYYDIAGDMMNGNWLRDNGVKWKKSLTEQNKTHSFHKLLLENDSTEAISRHLNEYQDTTNLYYPLIKESKWFENSWYNHIHKINHSLAVILHRCQQKENFKDVFLVGCSRLDSWNHPNNWTRFFYNGEYIYTRNNTNGIGINIHGDQNGIYFYIYSTKSDASGSPKMIEAIKKYQLDTTDNVYYKSAVVNRNESDSKIEVILQIMEMTN